MLETNNDLGFALYSINKYAKKYRDITDTAYGIERDNAMSKKKELYNLKESVLSFFEPCQIHRVKTKQIEVKIVLENTDAFKRAKAKVRLKYIPETGLYQRYKKIKTNKKRVLYFLYYEINGFKFHKPVEHVKDFDLKNCNLPKVNLPIGWQVEAVSCEELMEESKAVSIVSNFILEMAKNKET